MTTEATATSETTTDQRQLVKDMDEQARIAYLAGLMGKRVRFATTRDTAPLFKAFGEHTIIPWQKGVAQSFSLYPSVGGSAKMFVVIDRTP